MISQYRHCLQILTGCSKINFLHFQMILHHFVTYLSNDLRTSYKQSDLGCEVTANTQKRNDDVTARFLGKGYSRLNKVPAVAVVWQ